MLMLFFLFFLFFIAVFNPMRYKPIDALCPMPNPQVYLIELRRAIFMSLCLCVSLKKGEW